MKELDGGVQATLQKGMQRTRTREMVENAARKIQRENQDRRIKKYFVNVAGEDFPPKRLIANALNVTADLLTQLQQFVGCRQSVTRFMTRIPRPRSQ